MTGILHLTERKFGYYTGSYDQFDTERRMKLEQQQSMARKQDAQRQHIQSFVDRFRYKASKARQAQSRLKQLEKMQPIMALSEQAVSPFRFPTPEELPPPLLVLEDVAVGYDQKPVLRKLDLRCGVGVRLDLLGGSGAAKATLSKLFAVRLHPFSGAVKQSGNLRIGFFAQHQLDELIAGESPYQHMQRLRPKDLPTKLRARLGGAGFNADIVDNPVERLSGGQKARLLMAMAAIDAPHILILDEPTNHLDIESREALVHALNAYEGTVILVSHDSHLVEMIADQLWIVQDGKVASFDGDMADYQRQLLACRGTGSAHSQRDGYDQIATPNDQAPRGSDEKSGGKSQSPGRVRRQNTNQLRANVKQCEKLMVQRATEKDVIVAEMAKPGFYDSDNADAIAGLSSQRAKIDKLLAEAEQAWLAAEESLAEAETNG